MAASFQWTQTVGSSASPISADLGVSGNLFNLQAADIISASEYTNNPINAGNNSYEVWLQGHFTGTFNQIQNVKFWKNSGALGTGESLKFGSTSAYDTPETGASTEAASDIASAEPASPNIGFDGSTGNALSSAGFTDFIVLQLQTTSAAEAGDTESFSYSLKFSEN